jgi:hypothetical protein
MGQSEISTVDDDELDSDEISEVRMASTFYLSHSGSFNLKAFVIMICTCPHLSFQLHSFHTT